MMKVLYEKDNVTGQLVEVQKKRYNRMLREDSWCDCYEHQTPRKKPYDGYNHQPSMEELFEKFPQFIEFMRDYLDQNDPPHTKYETYDEPDEWGF